MEDTNENKELIEEEDPQYNNPYRFFNTFIMVVSAIFNSFIVQTLSTINTEVTTYFPSVSTTQVSLCALVFMITHPFVTFLSNYVLDSYPIKLGISINCVLVSVGVCIRMLINFHFVWVIIGNFIVAFGNIYILNIPAKFSALWFAPKKRLLITSWIVFGNTISGGVGAILSPIFVKDNLSQEEGKQKLIDYIMIQGFVIVGVMMLNLVLFRGNPNSKEMCFSKKELKKNENSPPYFATLKLLFKSKDYILLVWTMMFSLSVLNCFSTNLELYIVPFGLTSKDAGISTGISVISGLLGAIISGIISKHSFIEVKKTKKYKLILRILYALSLIVLGLLTIALTYKIIFLYWFCTVLFGITIFPILPGLIEYSCERMYPIGQATVAGIMFGSGQLMSFLMGLLQSFILKDKTREGVTYCSIINFSLFILSLILISLTTQKLNRLEAKKNPLLQDNEDNNNINEERDESLNATVDPSQKK